MLSIQTIWIICGVAAGLFVVAMAVVFFVSRKSQRVMQSVLNIMTRPEHARVQDAVRVLNSIMADEMAKLESVFNAIRVRLPRGYNNHWDSKMKNWLRPQMMPQKNWP